MTDLVQLGLGRLDTAKLYPPFLEEIIRVLEGLRPRRFVATSGWRSEHAQDAIYAIGRTDPPDGKVKTNVKGPWSYHVWGLAIDFAADVDPATSPLEPSWAPAMLRPLAEACEASGKLQSGMFFRGFMDAPHVQLKLPDGVGLANLQDLSLAAAWRKLDGFYARLS